MSWTDEELDALVKEAADAKKIAYKDAYWHEMEAMLGTAPSRKTIGWWWFSGIAFLAITIGATVVASNNSNVFNANILANSTELIEANLSIPSLNSANNTDATSNAKNNAVIGNQSESVSVNDMKTIAIKSNEKLVRTGTLTNEKSSSNKSKQGTNELNTSDPFINHRTIDTPGLTLDDQVFVPAETGTETENGLDENLTEKEKKQNLEVSEMILMDWNYPLAKPFERVPTSMPYLASKRFGFYAGLYGGIGQSYVATESKNTMMQLGVRGGVEFFVKKWSFGVGLGYRQQFAQNLEIHSRRQYYTYGLMNINQNIEYDQLLFADLILNANYSFGRSEIGIQASPSYMLGARMSYSEDREEILGEKSIITKVPPKNNQFVSSKNFKALSLNLGLSYSYAIRKNTLLNLNLNTRVGASLLNNSFDGNQRTTPLMLEFGIKRRF